MKKTISILLIPFCLMAATSEEIAKKADEKISGYVDSLSRMNMVLINANGEKSVKKMEYKTLEGESEEKSILVFDYPLDIKETKLLTYDYTDQNDDQWIYLPSLKRVKKIAARNKSGSFMGSEFSYEDMSGYRYDKYTYSGEAETVKDGALEYYRILATPKDPFSAYTKQIVWIDYADNLVRRVEYFDKKSSLFKTAYFNNYTKIKGVYRVGEIRMVNHQNDKQTILEWVKDDIRLGLDPKGFSRAVLKR